MDETEAGLAAARQDAEELRVLLALRTHQYDLAWQTERRLTEALEAERARADALAAEGEQLTAERDRLAAEVERLRPEAGSVRELKQVRERYAAALQVIGAVLASLRWFGLDRRRFKALIAQIGRDTPESGPAAERHAVLLAEGRRVLGIKGD